MFHSSFRRWQTISLVLLYFIMVGCKQEGSKDVVEAPSEKSYVYFNQEGVKPNEIATWRSSAAGILEKRQNDYAKKSYTELDKDIWLVDAYVNGSKMTAGDSVRGAWIDFKDDLTYEYGFGNKKTGTGKYFYEYETSKLLMLDNNSLMKPQEFNVRLRNDMIILVGEYVYRDNNLQSRLSRGKSYPVNRLEQTESK